MKEMARMKAVVCTGYGPPEVLKVAEVNIPVPGDNEVRIKVHSTTCHIGDIRIRSFDVPFWQRIPFRLYLGIRRPKRSIQGMELSGVVDEVGRDVKRLKKGDRVMACAGFVFGAHAEYCCLPGECGNARKGLVVKKPENMSFEEAAAGTATGGITAQEVLKKAGIQKDQKVLIYGASGSVGIFALQLARYYGAKVTGVCSTTNLELVRSLGADRVIDYTKEDLAKSGESYDLIFDAVDKLPRSTGRKLLKKGGTYLNVNRDSGSGTGVTEEDLEFLKELIEEGKLKTTIDRKYPLEQMVEAHRYVEKGHKKGHVLITVNEEIK
jgi:NADPH:quinone reductase-like Zn-dependent oxidoreductase